jgi:hypothetical protein
LVALFWEVLETLGVGRSCRKWIIGAGHWGILPLVLSLFFFFFVVLGFELRAYTLSHYTSTRIPFLCVMGFFEIVTLELFAQAGFPPQSSWSLPPE